MESGTHAIHRLDHFLIHLAQREPDLLGLLPVEEQPRGLPIEEWILSLQQHRLMEICTSWVLESLRRLKSHSPVSNHLLRGCIHLGGEFDLSDAAAIAIGEVPELDNPRRDEIRSGLMRAVRAGLLIYLPEQERYCVPFPVRLSFEGIDFLSPLDKDRIRLRIVHNFSRLISEADGAEEFSSPRHWRFFNILKAWELCVDLMEERLGLENGAWLHHAGRIDDVSDELILPLLDFADVLGRVIVQRQSEGGARLLAASAAAARTEGDKEREADLLGLLGQFYLRRYHWPAAIEVFRLVERLRREDGDIEGALVAVSAIAIACRDMGSREVAVGEFLRACNEAKELRLAEPALDTANCTARLLIELERPLEAIQLLESVEEAIGDERFRLPAVSEHYVLLGVATRLLGTLPTSREHLFMALNLSRRFVHRPAEAEAALETGWLELQEGRHEEARRWFRRATALFREINDRAGRARSLLAQAEVLRREGSRVRAEEMLGQAAEMARAVSHWRLLAEVLRRRGELELERGNMALAVNQYASELKALRRARENELLVNCHVRIAKLYLRQEMMLAAGTEILRAQGIARAYLRGDEPEDLTYTFAKIHRLLSPEQFNFLIDEVTEELEEGKIGPMRPKKV